MASIINTGSFPADLLPMITKWFGDSYPDAPKFYERMIAVEQAEPRNYQIDALVQGFGLMATKTEGNALEYDFSKEGYKPTYQHITYGLGFMITMEMMEDGDHMRNAKVFTEMLKYSANQTKEVIGANLFNNAFTSTVTMTNGDTVCLVSTSHPTPVGNQSNLITGGSVDISEAAIEQMTIDTKNLKNARGLRIGAMPRKLIVSVTDEPQAHRILGSPLRSGVADNDINYLRSQSLVPEGIVANPFLTGTHAFFMVNDVPNGLKMLMRKDATIDSANDFDSKNAKYSVIMRLVTGWTDWRQVIGSNGP